jgi:hypothetical protein
MCEHKEFLGSIQMAIRFPSRLGIEKGRSHWKGIGPWMILGAKFFSWDNFPWFFPKEDSLF